MGGVLVIHQPASMNSHQVLERLGAAGLVSQGELLEGAFHYRA